MVNLNSLQGWVGQTVSIEYYRYTDKYVQTGILRGIMTDIPDYPLIVLENKDKGVFAIPLKGCFQNMKLGGEWRSRQ